MSASSDEYPQWPGHFKEHQRWLEDPHGKAFDEQLLREAGITPGGSLDEPPLPDAPNAACSPLNDN